MNSEDHDKEEWPDFMSRMIDGFDHLINSRPGSLEDVIDELRTHEESITFLDPILSSVPGLRESDVHDIPMTMQRYGYYASIQGPWLLCSKSRKHHDKMLFAAQASQVLAEANMRLVPVPSD